MNVLQCHSRGDKRYSALYARLANGQSIETLYQMAKRDAEGQPFASPKGKQPVWMQVAPDGELLPAAEVQYAYYRMLWHVYFLEQPALLRHAAQYAAFEDIFEGRGHRPYCWDDEALPQKCLQSVAIADIVGTLHRGQRYVYPPSLAAGWKTFRP